MKINDYKKDLEFANNASDKANNFIFEKLRRFYNISSILSVEEKQLQFNGVDKIIRTTDGKIIKLEEKIRRITRNDILVELIADTRYYLKKPRGLGWGLKPYTTNLLMYYFEDTDTGWIFSWEKFQKALLKNMPVWYDYAKNNQYGFSFKYAYNYNYKSMNIVIPNNAILNAYIEQGGSII